MTSFVSITSLYENDVILTHFIVYKNSQIIFVKNFCITGTKIISINQKAAYSIDGISRKWRDVKNKH